MVPHKIRIIWNTVIVKDLHVVEYFNRRKVFLIIPKNKMSRRSLLFQNLNKWIILGDFLLYVFPISSERIGISLHDNGTSLDWHFICNCTNSMNTAFYEKVSVGSGYSLWLNSGKQNRFILKGPKRLLYLSVLLLL